MAVPDTDTFSLTDVQTNLIAAGLSGSFDDLAECIAAADVAGSPLYPPENIETYLDAFPNSLYGFRGYDHYVPVVPPSFAFFDVHANATIVDNGTVGSDGSISLAVLCTVSGIAVEEDFWFKIYSDTTKQWIGVTAVTYTKNGDKTVIVSLSEALANGRTYKISADDIP